MNPETLAEQLNITVEQVLFIRRVAVYACDRLLPLPWDETDYLSIWQLAFILHTVLNHLPLEAIANCYRISEDDYPLLASLKSAQTPPRLAYRRLIWRFWRSRFTWQRQNSNPLSL
jgi:hypothetical protein